VRKKMKKTIENKQKPPPIDTSGSFRDGTDTFIFDLMPFAKNAVVVEVDAFNHHAVLKNATGSNSPKTVKRDISALHTAWLRQPMRFAEYLR